MILSTGLDALWRMHRRVTETWRVNIPAAPHCAEAASEHVCASLAAVVGQVYEWEGPWIPTPLPKAEQPSWGTTSTQRPAPQPEAGEGAGRAGDALSRMLTSIVSPVGWSGCGVSQPTTSSRNAQKLVSMILIMMAVFKQNAYCKYHTFRFNLI